MPEVSKEIDGNDKLQVNDTTSNSVHRVSSNIETAEVFDFSISDLGGMPIKSPVAVDIHPVSKAPLHGSWCYDGTNKEHQKFSNLAKYGQNLSIDAVSSHDSKISHCSTEVGFLSSNAKSSNEKPSFEFFVVSDEGINLYVDLNSSPSEWITSLKDEVCIDQRSQLQSLGSLYKSARCFSDSGQHVKASTSERNGPNLQNNVVETNTGCTNSSFCSIVSENCQSEVLPLHAPVTSSGSFIITGSHNPVETSENLGETKELSSPCIAHSNSGHSKMVDDIFFSQGQTFTHQDSSDASLRAVQSCSSVHDLSDNANENHCTGVTTNLDETTQCLSLKFQKKDSDNAEDTTENISATSFCEKSNLTELDENLNNSKITDFDIVEDQITMEHDHLQINSECNNVESLCDDGQPSDVNQLENSLADGPASTYENLRKSNRLKEKEKSLEQNALDKVSKRSRRSDFNEGNQIKRRESVGNNKNGTLPNTKSLMKKNANDPTVFRRRSSRLLSKVT